MGSMPTGPVSNLIDHCADSGWNCHLWKIYFIIWSFWDFLVGCYHSTLPCLGNQDKALVHLAQVLCSSFIFWLWPDRQYVVGDWAKTDLWTGFGILWMTCSSQNVMEWERDESKQKYQTGRGLLKLETLHVQIVIWIFSYQSFVMMFFTCENIGGISASSTRILGGQVCDYLPFA